MKPSGPSFVVLLVTACVGLGLSGCAGTSGTDPALASEAASASLISDAGHGGGTPGFYFLPPIAPHVHRHGPTVRGLSPQVTIEELGGRGIIATFTRSGCARGRSGGKGHGEEGVREEHDRYVVDWEFERDDVRDGFAYRILVAVNGVELGFADARRAKGRVQRAQALQAGFVPLGDDELEIAFRIEPEALGSASRTIGIDGGRVCAANGACIVIPPGALDAPAALNIEQTTLAAPAGRGAVTPVYRLSPEGKVFAKPVQLVLPIPEGTTASSVYWTAMGSTTQFDSVGGRVASGFVTAENVHFSLTFAGAPSATRTITGSRVITYISATTRDDTFTAPTVAVEALVDDGAGGLRAIPGTFHVDAAGAPNGVFTIPEVPPGRYLLHVANQYFVTDANAPDLGFSSPGRISPSMVPAPVPTSFLDVALSMGNPWQAGDWLEVVGTENGMWDFNTERLATLVPGDTTTQFRIALNAFNGSFTRWIFEQPAIPCSAGTPSGTWCGDRFHVAHLSSATSPMGVPYSYMSEIAQFEPFETTTVPGSAVSLSATLAPLPITRTVDFDLRGAEFLAAVMADCNPSAVLLDPTLDRFVAVVGQPGLATDGFYSGNTDMLTVRDVDATNIRTGPVAYGSPDSFGGSWGEIGVMRWSAPVPVTAAGAAPTVLRRSPSCGFSWTDSLANMAVPAIVAPVMTMPTGVTVTGAAGPASFFEGGTGIGTTPTISWSPPRIGSPDVYAVSVSAVSNVGGATRVSGVAAIYTPETSVTLPPGILQPGQGYVFRVVAARRANALAPFRDGLGDYDAATVSGQFTP